MDFSNIVSGLGTLVSNPVSLFQIGAMLFDKGNVDQAVDQAVLSTALQNQSKAKDAAAQPSPMQDESLERIRKATPIKDPKGAFKKPD
jgi:hypothetical protein